MIDFSFGKICKTRVSKPSGGELIALVVVLLFVYLVVLRVVG